MSTTDETPFVRASDLLDGRAASQPKIDAKHTKVEYATGTEAVAIYPAADDGPHFGTTEWVSAVGESFVSLDDAI